MTRWRELLIVGVLFASLVVFMLYGPGRAAPDRFGQRGSAHSLDDEGALALQRWLETLGYKTANLESQSWQIPQGSDALLILNAVKRPILDREAQEIVRWVRDGGTLIAIDERPQLQLSPNRLWPQLGASTIVTATGDADVAQQALPSQPVLIAPLVTAVPIQTNRSLRMQQPEYVTLLQTRFGPALIGRQEGRGYAYIGVSAYPFTNKGLREPGSAALVLNLIARVPPGGTILFDEYHHGYGQAAASGVAPSLRRLLLTTWWGWASIYATGVIALYIALGGRRFGRAVPLPVDTVRRSSGEYVTSIAQLLQRAGKRREIGLHFRDRLKRRVAQHYGLVPRDDDDPFLRDLLHASGAPEQQVASLRQLLAALRRPHLREVELVQAVRALDRIVDPRGRLR